MQAFRIHSGVGASYVGRHSTGRLGQAAAIQHPAIKIALANSTPIASVDDYLKARGRLAVRTDGSMLARIGPSIGTSQFYSFDMVNPQNAGKPFGSYMVRFSLIDPVGTAYYVPLANMTDGSWKVVNPAMETSIYLSIPMPKTIVLGNSPDGVEISGSMVIGLASGAFDGAHQAALKKAAGDTAEADRILNTTGIGAKAMLQQAAAISDIVATFDVIDKDRHEWLQKHPLDLARQAIAQVGNPKAEEWFVQNDVSLAENAEEWAWDGADEGLRLYVVTNDFVRRQTEYVLGIEKALGKLDPETARLLGLAKAEIVKTANQRTLIANSFAKLGIDAPTIASEYVQAAPTSEMLQGLDGTGLGQAGRLIGILAKKTFRFLARPLTKRGRRLIAESFAHPAALAATRSGSIWRWYFKTAGLGVLKAGMKAAGATLWAMAASTPHLLFTGIAFGVGSSMYEGHWPAWLQAAKHLGEQKAKGLDKEEEAELMRDAIRAVEASEAGKPADQPKLDAKKKQELIDKLFGAKKKEQLEARKKAADLAIAALGNVAATGGAATAGTDDPQAQAMKDQAARIAEALARMEASKKGPGIGVWLGLGAIAAAIVIGYFVKAQTSEKPEPQV